MKTKGQVEVTKTPKKIRGIVNNIERSGLKYSLVSGKREYVQGVQLEILVGNKIQIAKLPDTQLDLLKRDILNREVEYTYTKLKINTAGGALHNWYYEIKTVDKGDNFSKTYSKTL